jgi:nicotinamidase-related amidase
MELLPVQAVPYRNGNRPLLRYRSHTALVAMDCQAGIVSIYANPPEQFVERASSMLRAARKAAMPVVHVQVGFRPGLPEVSSRNKLFAAIKSSLQHQQLFQAATGASTRHSDRA